jgi:translocation and assembly module TamB
MQSGRLVLDSLSLAGEYAPDSSEIEAALWSPQFRLYARAGITADGLLTLSLQNLEISYGNQQWSLDSGASTIAIDSAGYSIDGLHLSPGGNDGQAIHVAGQVDLDHESNVAVTVANLELAPLGSLIEYDLEGRLSTEIALTGKLDMPEIAGKFAVADLRVQQRSIHELAGELTFSEGTARFGLDISATPGDSVNIAGTFPILVDGGQTAVDTEGPISISIRIDSLPLSIIAGDDTFIENADGYIDCDLSISETINDPVVEGGFSIRNGGLSATEYGVKYHDIQVGLSFLPNRVMIDSVTMLRSKGKLHLSGSLDYDSSLIAGQIRSARVDLLTDEFYVVRHRDYEVQLSSDVAVRGDDNSAVYSGSITVDRSRLFLPALISDTDQAPVDDLGLPLLVAATRDTAADSLRNGSLVDDEPAHDSLVSDMMSMLSGRMKLTIPRNTWIKSPELSLELAGDLEIVQEGGEPELFGNIRVVRGHYDLYGRRFKVQRGQVMFSGGDYLNPVLDVEARYVFRTPTREKKELNLVVTGTAEVPAIKFTLDGTEVPEGDAVSYIVFGRSLDQLNQSQQSALGQKPGTTGMAAGLASRVLAGQLAGVLDRTLNLDVIEIKAGEDLEAAAVIIGKYITPDLFMSYQRSFGSSRDDDLEPEIVTLEYQLARLIYLQLTEGDADESGFDVILKIERD